jgi:rhamnulokinase
MSSKKTCLSIDLGAESGRVTGVSYDGKGLHLNELHRFSTIPVKNNGTFYSDILKIRSEAQTGIEKGKQFNPVSIGIDSWGVDFALLDSHDNLLSNPVHYRDSRTDGMMEKTFSVLSKKEIFSQTGIQFMPINTLYQIMSLVESKSSHLSDAKTFLAIPDLLNFWLTGTKVCEFTNATTTQMYNPLTNDWAKSLLNELHIPTRILPEIVQPGTKLGEYEDIPVLTVASHDTGSAVAAVPAQGENFVYISSGTWSLVGVEVKEPVINDSALEANITNEGGVYGTFRLLKNVMGLWILQECRRHWQSEGNDYSYNELANLANYAQPLKSFIFPNDPMFLHSGNYPQLIKDFCKKTSQPVPEREGEIVRCVLESLALTYKTVLNKLLKISGKKADAIYIIGGGSRNELLNQMTANATGLPVIAGPSEATVIGNAVVQLITLGELKDITEARQLISNMSGLKKYEPENIEAWDEAYAQYNKYDPIKKN